MNARTERLPRIPKVPNPRKMVICSACWTQFLTRDPTALYCRRCRDDFRKGWRKFI